MKIQLPIPPKTKNENKNKKDTPRSPKSGGESRNVT